MTDDAFVTVATFETTAAAMVAISALEAYGVRFHSPFLEQARLIGRPPFWGQSIELKVAVRDEVLAREILAGPPPAVGE
ncbi:hypothetical protein [Chenggangzhangella methanolivorans]|uniref:Uncharacterized protein n=1 Tax=Chenggangzhangella methanolivorans TaxID=1437009 RepID=A0A9E6UPD1_9HYPH|nr:hypothetical protein [Chenggangzhangella methanolivorans]QZO02206.1 hypothetical protein K6K41_13740 [Chenggangzhangella methanolivorans]